MDNGSIVDISLNVSILRWDRLRLITGAYCNIFELFETQKENWLMSLGKILKWRPQNFRTYAPLPLLLNPPTSMMRNRSEGKARMMPAATIRLSSLAIFTVPTRGISLHLQGSNTVSMTSEWNNSTRIQSDEQNQSALKVSLNNYSCQFYMRQR